jgi:hypothetical protein
MNNHLPSRRKLLSQVLPACSICFGFARLSNGSIGAQQSQVLPVEKKAAQKADMSYADLFSFSYGKIIPVFQSLCDQIGKEKFIDILRLATYDKAFRSMEAMARNMPEVERNLPTFISFLRNPNAVFQNTLTYEILKDTEKEAEIKITECLWANTFRKLNAAEIGYAFVCIDDEASVKAYNPKITLNRPKLLMRGDDECRYLYRMLA